MGARNDLEYAVVLTAKDQVAAGLASAKAKLKSFSAETAGGGGRLRSGAADIWAQAEFSNWRKGSRGAEAADQTQFAKWRLRQRMLEEVSNEATAASLRRGAGDGGWRGGGGAGGYRPGSDSDLRTIDQTLKAAAKLGGTVLVAGRAIGVLGGLLAGLRGDVDQAGDSWLKFLEGIPLLGVAFQGVHGIFGEIKQFFHPLPKYVGDAGAAIERFVNVSKSLGELGDLRLQLMGESAGFGVSGRGGERQQFLYKYQERLQQITGSLAVARSQAAAETDPLTRWQQTRSLEAAEASSRAELEKWRAKGEAEFFAGSGAQYSTADADRIHDESEAKKKAAAERKRREALEDRGMAAREEREAWDQRAANNKSLLEIQRANKISRLNLAGKGWQADYEGLRDRFQDDLAAAPSGAHRTALKEQFELANAELFKREKDRRGDVRERARQGLLGRLNALQDIPAAAPTISIGPRFGGHADDFARDWWASFQNEKGALAAQAPPMDPEVKAELARQTEALSTIVGLLSAFSQRVGVVN